MPVPLNGLAKNFKAIDISTNNSGGVGGGVTTYLEMSSSTSSISTPCASSASISASNYTRPQGLRNSNTSTMSLRSKLASTSSSSVNTPSVGCQTAPHKNYQHISSGSYSKLKSKYSRENSTTSSTVTMTPDLAADTNSSVTESQAHANFSSIKESFKALERTDSNKFLQIGKKNSSAKLIHTPQAPTHFTTRYIYVYYRVNRPRVVL